MPNVEKIDPAVEALARYMSIPNEDDLWHWCRWTKTADEYVEVFWKEWIEEATTYVNIIRETDNSKNDQTVHCPS